MTDDFPPYDTNLSRLIDQINVLLDQLKEMPFLTISDDDLEELRAQVNAITFRNFKVKGDAA